METLVLIGCPVMMHAVIPPPIWLAASSVSCILKFLLRALLTFKLLSHFIIVLFFKESLCVLFAIFYQTNLAFFLSLCLIKNKQKNPFYLFFRITEASCSNVSFLDSSRAESHSTGQGSLELLITLPLLPEYWDYRFVPSCLAHI